MKKIKGMAIFITIFLLILFANFLFYNNIDIFFTENEGKVVSYENNFKNEEKDFLIELNDKLENQGDYKIIKLESEETENIIKNKVICNIIIENSLKNLTDSEIKEILAYTSFIGKLSNTIYGELNILEIVNTNFFKIVYSNDMSKLCYINMSEISYRSDSKEIDFSGYEKDILEYDKISKEELIKSAKISFSKFVKDIEFTPDTIMYRENYYILKDIQNDVTVYYNVNSDTILGFYIGFRK